MVKNTYYVCASGNDKNDGLSEDMALKTLGKGIERAKKGSIKRITIIGTLNGNTERKHPLNIDNFSIERYIFFIGNCGIPEIIITGKSENDKAVLTGLTPARKQELLKPVEVCTGIVDIGDNSNITFENIIFTNDIEVTLKNATGLRIGGKNCKVTLGSGVEICGNNKSGVLIKENAELIISGGKIYKNTATEGGGIYIHNGDCILKHGEIINNNADYGAGVFQYYEDGYVKDDGPYSKKYYSYSGNLQLLGGKINNNTAEFVGGGVYISNGASFIQKGGEIKENNAKEEEGKDIFNQRLLNKTNISGKLFFGDTQVEYINDLISECREIPEKYKEDKALVEFNYIDFCMTKAKEIIDAYTVTDEMNFNFKMLNMISKYLISFWNYIVSINENKNNTYHSLNNLLFSAIKKFTLIINLMEQGDYENGLILFRSLYENIIIAEFLSFNHECIKPFEQFSFLRLKDRLPKDALENNKYFKEIHSEISKEYTKNIIKDYNWAQSVLEKTDITLLDIAQSIFERTSLTDEMYKMSSELLHSNTGILNSYEFSGILMLTLKKYMERFGLPFILKTFMDIFYESNYFEINVFLKIIENVLDIGYNYKLDIR